MSLGQIPSVSRLVHHVNGFLTLHATSQTTPLPHQEQGPTQECTWMDLLKTSEDGSGRTAQKIWMDFFPIQRSGWANRGCQFYEGPAARSFWHQRPCTFPTLSWVGELRSRKTFVGSHGKRCFWHLCLWRNWSLSYLAWRRWRIWFCNQVHRLKGEGSPRQHPINGWAWAVRTRSWGRVLCVLTPSQRPTRGQPTEIKGRGATAGVSPDLPLGSLWLVGASPGEGLARCFQREPTEEKLWGIGSRALITLEFQMIPGCACRVESWTRGVVLLGKFLKLGIL